MQRTKNTKLSNLRCNQKIIIAHKTKYFFVKTKKKVYFFTGMVMCGSNLLKNIQTSKELYKFLLRECKKLPNDAGKHYKFMIRQSYNQHINETDPDRISAIIAKSIKDAEWIVKKYTK